ncbi:PD-(D/E)XK nuclease-like domain-containing protein [Nocardia nova]
MTAPTEPGLYNMVPEDVYHGDLTALSHSGAKSLAKTAPAQWIYDWLNPEPVEVNEIMEQGSAFHSLTLGVGAKVVEIKAENWTRKADQQIRKEHRAAGEIPLLTAKYRRVMAMADAVRLHPIIGPQIEQAHREVSGWFRDPETGIMRRFRVDALYGRRAIDLKSTETADPREFAKSIRKFGYHQQDPWYCEGITEITGEPAEFVMVAVSRRPPHLISLNVVPAAFAEYGRELNRRAIDTFAECTAADHWPDYGTGLHCHEQPTWAYRED